jgi:hypothetical protein
MIEPSPEGQTMGKLGNIVSDPKIGAYCDVTLDNGEKLIVNHDKGGIKGGRLTVEKKKWMGLGSDRLCACDLDSAAGQAAVARLTEGVPPHSGRATPLVAFAEYLKDSKSADDARARFETLMAGA